jgi:hypothetical protein
VPWGLVCRTSVPLHHVRSRQGLQSSSIQPLCFLLSGPGGLAADLAGRPALCCRLHSRGQGNQLEPACLHCLGNGWHAHVGLGGHDSIIPVHTLAAQAGRLLTGGGRLDRWHLLQPTCVLRRSACFCLRSASLSSERKTGACGTCTGWQHNRQYHQLTLGAVQASRALGAH